MKETIFLDEIQSFLARNPKITETGFGESALNDGHFIKALKRGRRVWPDTKEKVLAWMRAHDSAAQRGSV